MMANAIERWVIYQRERFPLAAHAPLIAAFSVSGVCYSALLRHQSDIPWDGTAVAFCTALLFFLQLRIADEFKDFEEDSRHRPYRPVPRGLVTLRELGVIGIVAAILQLGLALAVRPALALILIMVWAYLALMSVEFFAGDWLKARPVTYLWTHMLIMPMIDFYATACDWMVQEAELPAGLAWFLMVSFFNGIVIEIGRKLRAPADEEPGVQTYTVLWGSPGALRAWIGAMSACGACALAAAASVDFLLPVAALLLALLGTALMFALRFLRNPAPGTGRRFELLSGIWTLAMYLMVGVVPLLARNFG